MIWSLFCFFDYYQSTEIYPYQKYNQFGVEIFDES